MSGVQTRAVILVAVCLLLAALPQSALAVDSAYVGNFITDNTSQFDVGADGSLSLKTPGTVATGNGPYAIAISPDGRDFYVANGDGNGVGQFDIGASGLLAPMTPSSIAAGTTPRGIAISPDGGSIYVANYDGDNVSQYDVGAGGLLTPKTPPTVAAGNGPWSISISPNGDSVYVGNFDGNDISQYNVGAAGLLTAKTPATLTTGTSPFFSTMSADGDDYYVTNFGANTISQYNVGVGGLLTPKAPATVPTAGSNPAGITITPDGWNAYVGNSGSSNVSQYDVGADGRLAAKTPPTVAAGVSPGQLTASPDGRSVYATNFGSNTVSQYDIGAGGLLAAKTPPTVAVGSNPRWIALVPNQGPVASFAATAATAGSASTFNGTGSSDPDGSIARYSWDFGDGSTTADGGSSPSHVYAAGGSYTVTLTVTDDEGCSASFVSTGQYAYCNGGPAGRTTRVVNVPSLSFGEKTLVALQLAKKRIRSKGPVPVRVVNSNDFEVEGNLRGDKGRIGLKPKSFNLGADSRKTVKLELPKPLRKPLLRKHKLTLALTLEVTDPAGNERKVKKTVTPKLKRKKSR